MVSETEQKAVQSLRKLPDPLPDVDWIEQSDERPRIDWHFFLGNFIDQFIHEIHPDCAWTDGLMPALCLRAGANEFLFAGYTWMLDRDGCFVAPFHLQLQISPTVDEVTWLECRLGERDRIKSNEVRMSESSNWQCLPSE